MSGLWYSGLKQKPVLCGILLFLASVDRLYPVQFVLPLFLLMEKTRDRIIFMTTISICFIWVFSTQDILSNWRLMFWLSEYNPGLNSAWYMLIELFDHFRTFFVLILQVIIKIYYLFSKPMSRKNGSKIKFCRFTVSVTSCLYVCDSSPRLC